MPPSTILIVDDEPGIREAYRTFLAPPSRARAVTSHRLARPPAAAEGAIAATLLCAASGEEAVELVRGELASGRRVQAGFFDMKMPGGIDGVETIRQVLALEPDLMCVVVTAYTDQPLDEIRALFGAARQDDWDYLNKPFSANEVLQKARNALASWWRRRRDEAQLSERTERLVEANAELERGHSAMAQVLNELRAANDRLRLEMAERARLEEERRLASKLEGIGQLAAGIAHEINTPTQYILSNAEMLALATRDLLPEVERMTAAVVRHAPDEELRAGARKLLAELPGLEHELEAAIRSVLGGAESIARIVGAMREFARSDPPEMRPADLNGALRATLEVVRHEYRQVAEVVLEAGELPMVSCHVGEIQQVFANLIVNAAHAIGRRGLTSAEGRIRVTSSHDRTRACAVVTIADNGVGIAPEHRERVFEPFFTTKPAGQGTGQGLSLARSVVLRHQGGIEFESTVGVGTRFVVTLPVGRRGEGLAA